MSYQCLSRIEVARNEISVSIDRSRVATAVDAREQARYGMLPHFHCAVKSYESPLWPQGLRGVPKHQLSLVVSEVMENSEQENDVKLSEPIDTLVSYVPAVKLCPTSVSISCRFYVLWIVIKSHIRHISQSRNYVGRSAADVKNSVTRLCANHFS